MHAEMTLHNLTIDSSFALPYKKGLLFSAIYCSVRIKLLCISNASEEHFAWHSLYISSKHLQIHLREDCTLNKLIAQSSLFLVLVAESRMPL